jgi:hypothetical protein
LSQLFFYLQTGGDDGPPEPGPELDLVSGGKRQGFRPREKAGVMGKETPIANQALGGVTPVCPMYLPPRCL